MVSSFLFCDLVELQPEATTNEIQNAATNKIINDLVNIFFISTSITKSMVLYPCGDLLQSVPLRRIITPKRICPY